MRPNFEFYMASLDGWPFEVGVDLQYAEADDCGEVPFRRQRGKPGARACRGKPEFRACRETAHTVLAVHASYRIA